MPKKSDLMKLVHITWKDHNTLTSGWQGREDIIRKSSPSIMETIGAVVSETPEIVCLIHTYSDSDNCLHAINILKTDIIKRRRLFYK